MGSFIFLLFSTKATEKTSNTVKSRHHLNDIQHLKLFGTYLSRILFQFITMIIFPLYFDLYIYCNNNYKSLLFVDSGLFSILWLLITGISIKLAYYIIITLIKYFNNIDLDYYFQNIEFLWILCPMTYGLLFAIYDIKIMFSILAIVLGKFIWFDSFHFYSMKDIKKKITELKKKFQVDYFLLKYQLVILGYFLLRYYPLKDSNITFS